MKLEAVVRRLASCKTSAEAQALLKELLDHHGAKFRPLGDMPGNHGAVEVGGNADSAMIERGTNAIDATLDLKAEREPALKALRSPREFVEKAYGIPGGQLAEEHRVKKLERLVEEAGIFYRFHNGDRSRTMTIDVRDHGIGIAPDLMPNTILSLHGTNKISKWYLMGQFGQGGAPTLRFSDFSIILSRKAVLEEGEEDAVGFTILLYRDPKEDERFGSYVYVVGADNNLFRVPAPALNFEPGTLVRHINFQVGFASSLVASSAYSVLHARLFDPLLPAWMEFRVPPGTKGAGSLVRRRIFGNRRRLTRSPYVEAQDERWTFLAEDEALGKLIVRYWVLKSDTDRSKKSSFRSTKGSFVDPNYPIHVTYLGQSHAVLPKGLLKARCKLPFTYDHVIVQVDSDGVTRKGRQRLFTATREQLTSEGKALVEQAITRCLLDDPTLREIEEERRERQFEEGLRESTEDLRRALAEMLDRIRPGKYSVKIPIKADGKGKPRKRVRKKKYRGGEPHPTQPDFPTYLRIASRGDPLKFYLDGTRTILIETDAPDGFLSKRGARARLALAPETAKVLDPRSQDVDFKNGWLRITVRLSDGAKKKTEFQVKIILRFRKDGKDVQLDDTRLGLVVEGTGGPSDKEQKIDAPLVIPVKREMSQWVELGWSEADVAEVKGNGGTSIIYVSLENEWLTGTLTRAKWSRAHMEYMRSRYVVQTAFHAFLLHEEGPPQLEGLPEAYAEALEDPELTERLRKAELVRAVRSILTALTTKGALEESATLEVPLEA